MPTNIFSILVAYIWMVSVDNCCRLLCFYLASVRPFNLPYFFRWIFCVSLCWPWLYFSGAIFISGSSTRIHPSILKIPSEKALTSWFSPMRNQTRRKVEFRYGRIGLHMEMRSERVFNRIKIWDQWVAERAIHFNQTIVELYFVNIYENIYKNSQQRMWFFQEGSAAHVLYTETNFFFWTNHSDDDYWLTHSKFASN